MFKKIYFIFFILIVHTTVFAQRSIKDINADLKNAKADSNKANFLLELALAYVHKPGEEKNDLNSALTLIRNAEVINSKNLNNKFLQAQACYVYSNAYREGGNNKVGQKYIDKSIELFKELPITNNEAEAFIEASQYPPIDDSIGLEKKIQFYLQAAEVFAKTKTADKESFALKNAGDLYHYMGNSAKALSVLERALTLCPSDKPLLLAGIYDLLGSLSFDNADYSRAVQYGLMAVNLSEKAGDTSLQLATVYYRLGDAYAVWHKNQDAVFYIQKAYDIAAKYNSVENMYIIMPALCKMLSESGKWQESIQILRMLEQKVKSTDEENLAKIYATYVYVYRRRNLPEQTERYVQKLQKIIDNYRDNIDEAVYYPLQCLTEYYSSISQYSKAKYYSEKMLIASDNYPAWVVTVYKLKSGIDSGLDDYKSALMNYLAYSHIKDSLTDASKSMQVAEMEVELKTDKVQNDLKLNEQKLQTANAVNKLQQQDLKQASLIKNIIIAIAVLITMLLYTGYQFKQRSNKKLQAKQNEINNQNQALVKTIKEKNNLLEEKEWLVKEIHHRVKNNLQIVISLLNTQSKYLDNKEALEAIAESRHRMQAMSLIHQKLYQSENTTSVNMQTYITELSDYLKTSFDNGKEINFVINIDAILLDISQAIPIGLILNEVITNAIKYAFQEKEAGNIYINMHDVKDDKILLEIKDNGIGLPDSFDLKNSTSMGMRLVNGLAKQINGKLNFENKDGVCVQVEFINDTKLTSIGIE
jgi:two-component sensor histidine kinase